MAIARWCVLGCFSTLFLPSLNAAVVHDTEFVDFISFDADAEIARGTLRGADVTVTSSRTVTNPVGGDNGGVRGGVLDGASTRFSDASRFSPTLPMGDDLLLGAASDFQIAFSRPVVNPTLHIFQLSTNRLSFTSGGQPAPFTLIASDEDFVVSNNNTSIAGVLDIGDDASGSLRFHGVFDDLSWTAETLPGLIPEGDGIWIQISVPEPSAVTLVGALILFSYGVALRTRGLEPVS